MKNQTSRVAVAIAFALAIPGIACAGTGTMFTAPLKPGDGNSLTCRITNVDDSPHEVRIFIYGWSYQTNADGTLIASGPTLNAPPLTTIRLSMAENDALSLYPRVCKFTIAGSKANFRAVGCATEGMSDDDITCVPAD